MLNLFNALPWFKKRKKRKATRSSSPSRAPSKKKKKPKKKAAKKGTKRKRVVRSPSTGRKVRTTKTAEDLERFESKLMGQLYDPETGELGRMATASERKRQMQNPDGYIRVNGRKMLVI